MHPRLVMATLGVGAALLTALPADAAACPRVTVPGAAKQVTACLDDLTTAGTVASGHTVPAQLAVAAKATLAQRYGRPPARTYTAGISNGGYLVRWQLEHRPGLYDGGIDVEGTLFRAQGPNLLTFLPPALRAYPQYAATGDKSGLVAAGFAAESDFLWPYHYQVYWDLTQRIYREELDPGFDGSAEAGTPFCASGTPPCDADYDYYARPASVRKAVERVSLSGRIGRPLLTVTGTLDSLLPITKSSDVYASLVSRSRRGSLHRYYRIEGGNHVDGLYDAYPDRLRPLLPCMRTAFTALEDWVESGVTPPPSATLPRPASGDLANTCSLTGG